MCSKVSFGFESERPDATVFYEVIVRVRQLEANDPRSSTFLNAEIKPVRKIWEILFS